MTQTLDLHPLIASLQTETGTGLVRRLVDPSSSLRIYLCIDRTEAQLGVMLVVPRNFMPAPKELPSGAGFVVRTHATKDDPKNVVNLCVYCTNRACEDIFQHFMGDLVSHLLSEVEPGAALKTFLARVTLWQRFFVSGVDHHLSEDAQCGLFAELLVLRDLLVPSVGASAAVIAWRGPEGRPQDFVLPKCALEVKSSRAKAGGRIIISNEQQLDERPFPHLGIVYVSLAAGGDTNPSLTEMVASVRTLLSSFPDALSAFDDRLLMAGWVDAHSSWYSSTHLFVREVRYFDVRDDFPRIRPGDFVPGIVDISYKIEVSSLCSFEIQRPVVEGWLSP